MHLTKANRNTNKNMKLTKADKNVAMLKFDELVINSLILSM